MGEKMIPLIATGPVLTAANAPMLHTQAAQLERITNSDSAPWIYSGLAQLRELEQVGDLKPGIGDFRIEQRTAATARLVLSLIPLVDLPVPVVSPISGGAVSITWSMGAREVKVACFPDGQVMYFNTVQDEIVEDGIVDLEHRRSVGASLTWMAQPQG
jgi:hypothetical protein